MVVDRLEGKERDECDDYSRRSIKDLNAAELQSKLKSGGDTAPYSKGLGSAAAGWASFRNRESNGLALGKCHYRTPKP
jgi:hypothetical protein